MVLGLIPKKKTKQLIFGVETHAVKKVLGRKRATFRVFTEALLCPDHWDAEEGH